MNEHNLHNVRVVLWILAVFAALAMVWALGVYCSVARADVTDRLLIITWPNGQELRACAKAQIHGLDDPCDVRNWHPIGFPPASAGFYRCIPHPNCFSEESNHIQGYN